ncbi:hypothetical protein ACFU3J_01885 [Streptomyces sp. NPDC057411]|uniref:hypothetical protein n=1 Tax=unclassified Streptomyces TaxID=2593676 RepID=UPI0036306BDE
MVAVKEDEFKEGYIARAIELADEVSRCGRRVILDGPSDLEASVNAVVELSGGLVSMFRFFRNAGHIAEQGATIVAYNTSGLPDQLKDLERGVREFLARASAVLERDPLR